MKKTPVHLWLLTLFITLLVSIISAALLFSLGLILIEFLLYPLALGITALLTGLTAVFLTNRLIHDGLQSPVEVVVGWCEGTAVILTLILIVGDAIGSLPAPPIVISSAAAIILAFVATCSARQFRRMPSADSQPMRRIVIWLIVALLAFPLVIFIASLFGWAGA